jgi:acyl-CoA synthetase (AMP-forming)/AMP-acid ligase II
MAFGFLPDQLRTMAELVPDEIGYTNAGLSPDDPDAHLTFRAWEARSNQLARWLVDEAGVAKGDRVSIHLPPERCLEWLVTYSAVHKAAAVAVPTSTRLVPRELAYVLDHAETVVALTGGAAAEALAQARADVPSLRRVVTTEVAAGADDVTWADAVTGDDGPFQVELDREDMADVMYTSGTTGRPKGVVVRHRGIALVPNGTPRWTGDGWLHASPMFTFAGIASTYNPMKMGMRGYYLPRFDVDRWLDVVERERPTSVFLVPAMAELLLASPRIDGADLSSIVMCSLGSAPIAPETLARLRQRLPQAGVSNAWGMTEAGPAFCFMPPEEVERRVGSVGKPAPPTEFKVVDDDGTELPPDTVGELLVRNPGREREYFRDAEATARSWQDGWLHSGDLARLDADGYLYIVGRKKDVIIRGGNNVHAADVEAVLYEHPAVQEAAVAGVPHDVLGEDVGAWIVLRPDAPATTAEDLIAFCRERLSDYKVPRQVRFVAELPRNATGKVLKQKLTASVDR